MARNEIHTSLRATPFMSCFKQQSSFIDSLLKNYSNAALTNKEKYERFAELKKIISLNLAHKPGLEGLHLDEFFKNWEVPIFNPSLLAHGEVEKRLNAARKTTIHLEKCLQKVLLER